MVFDPLMAISTLFTYFLQVAFVYLVIYGLCSLIRAPRIRVRMWGGFLLLGVGDWIWCCLATLGVSSSQSAAPAAGAETSSVAGWALSVAPSHAPRLAGFPAWASVIYLVIVAGFLIHLAAKAFSLRRFLATGDQPAQELNQLFSELCSEMNVQGCELAWFTAFAPPRQQTGGIPEYFCRRNSFPSSISRNLPISCVTSWSTSAGAITCGKGWRRWPAASCSSIPSCGWHIAACAGSASWLATRPSSGNAMSRGFSTRNASPRWLAG